MFIVQELIITRGSLSLILASMFASMFVSAIVFADRGLPLPVAIVALPPFRSIKLVAIVTAIVGLGVVAVVTRYPNFAVFWSIETGTLLRFANWGVPAPFAIAALSGRGPVQLVSIVTAVVSCVILYPNFTPLWSIKFRASFCM